MSAPYAGAPVPQAFRERWLTGLHIGDSKPVGMVEIRRGRLNHRYHKYPGLGFPTFGEYPGSLGAGFWYADWQPASSWMSLDGVQNIRIEQSFDQNGVATLTLKMDNKVLVPTTGPAGILYNIVQNGYYSPLRGFVAPKRPNPGIAKTPFFDKLPNAQIRVKQGYGADLLVTTFLGLIDDIETTSVPNEITITARDFGGVLVDEHVFGWAKEKNVPSPATFAPRSIAEKTELVGGGPRASSEQTGHSAANVLTRSGVWRSQVVNSSQRTEWIEITVPQGRYKQLYLSLPFNAQHIYFGIKPKKWHDQSSGKVINARFDGLNIMNQLDGDGWWNPYATQVPGATNGGWSFFAELQSSKKGKGRYVSLGGDFIVGDGTVIRLGFRNLASVDGGYQAGVSYLQAKRRNFSDVAMKGRYILIDDAADIVKTVLRWAGFKYWEVESTGVNLQEPYVADPSQSLMDLVNVVKDMTGFTFMMGEPRDDNDDNDLGYPIFRNNRVFENYTGKTEFIDDKLLLTDAKVKVSNQDDRAIVRCRGVSKDRGVTLDGDQTKRIMFAYLPAWAGEQASKQAGVIKAVSHTDEKFTTIEDCQFGCYLIALQIALLKYTAIIDLPANPGIGLDTLQSVIDRTQGLNSRIYVTNRTQEMQFGQSGFWTMELGGSLVDTPEVGSVVKDYKAALDILERGGKNPWLRKRKGKTLLYGYQLG